MNNWTVQQTRDVYNITQWGEGYFDINEQGELIAYPNRDHKITPINMVQLTQAISNAGLSLPVLVRFNGILKDRVDTLCGAFAAAIKTCHYKNTYQPVYPIKVNQQQQVIQQILQGGAERVGLEAGSKPELIAVLALSTRPKSVIVCNGYKDREYIRLALIGEKLGHQVYIIIEKFAELAMVLEESRQMGIKPRLGVRARLAATGAGKWQKSAGQKAKFGLSAAQILNVIEELRNADQLDRLQLLHFHLGSQIANIWDIQKGMRECARYYAELLKLGADIQCVDVGGGLGIDYEGTKSRSYFSTNYSIQEYANNVVYALQVLCDEYELPHPRIFTESGRAMTAHHAVLITNVTDVESPISNTPISPLNDDEHQIIHDLWKGWTTLDREGAVETYHDACQWLIEAQSLYTHGVLNLAERARAEQLYYATCIKVRDYLHPTNRMHREVLDELNEKLADKYFCNFSLFQSLPDVWAIDQVFPVLPLSRLNEPTHTRGILQDITCDSDGAIDRYVDGKGLESTLPLPTYRRDEPCWIGIFLVGAYQEILGDLHNLFGDTNSIHVQQSGDGRFELTQAEQGDTVEDVLSYVHFNSKELLLSYQQQLEQAQLEPQQRRDYLQELASGLKGYTYLED